MAAGTVLVVDDDEGSCELLCRLLARDGHAVERSDAEHAFSVVEAVRPSCVVLALSFGGVSRNFQLLDAIRSDLGSPVASTRVVLITYRADVQMPVSWTQTGADAVLTRPFHADELTRAVAGASTGAS